MSMNLDEDGALFDCCEPAKPVMPSFSSTVRLQPTQDQDGVGQLDVDMLAPDSAPVPANVTASASLSRSDCPLSPVASPIPSPLASPPCLSPPVAASPPLSPSPQRTSTLLAAAPYLSPLPSPEPTPAHSHTTPLLPLRLSPSPAITSNAPALIEPSPTPHRHLHFARPGRGVMQALLAPSPNPRSQRSLDPPSRMPPAPINLPQQRHCLRNEAVLAKEQWQGRLLMRLPQDPKVDHLPTYRSGLLSRSKCFSRQETRLDGVGQSWCSCG